MQAHACLGTVYQIVGMSTSARQISGYRISKFNSAELGQPPSLQRTTAFFVCNTRTNAVITFVLSLTFNRQTSSFRWKANYSPRSAIKRPLDLWIFSFQRARRRFQMATAAPPELASLIGCNCKFMQMQNGVITSCVCLMCY